LQASPTVGLTNIQLDGLNSDVAVIKAVGAVVSKINRAELQESTVWPEFLPSRAMSFTKTALSSSFKTKGRLGLHGPDVDGRASD